jgi:hypothetical protein
MNGMYKDGGKEERYRCFPLFNLYDKRKVGELVMYDGD